MPLNIDIQQILLHLFNFFLLLAGCYLLLYRPVKNFMDKRDATYSAMDEQAKAALNEAEEMKASYAAQMGDVDAEIREKRTQEAVRIEEQTSRQLREAREEADRILAEAHENARIEHDKMIASAREEIVNLAAETADKMLRQSLEMAEESGSNE